MTETNPLLGESRRGGPAPKRFIFVIAVISGLGGLLFGYDTANIAVALLSISDQFALTTQMEGVVASVVFVGAMAGALLGGPLSDRFGRRRLVLLVALVFTVGALGQALSPDVNTMLVFRLLLGLAVGGASSLVPVYVAELAPARLRGGLMVFFQFMVAFGQLIAYLTGYLLTGPGSWRWVFGLGIVPALVCLVGMVFMPETPRWLLKRGREQDARMVLERVVDGGPKEVEDELREIRKVEQAENTGGWRDVGKRWSRPAVVIGLIVSTFAQVAGVDGLVTFAPTILSDAGFGDSVAILTSVGIGAMLVLGAAAGILLVDRIGRRRILLLLLPFSAVSVAVLALTFLSPNVTELRWLVVGSLLAYIGFNGASIQVVVWLIGPEIFPLGIRGSAMGLAAITVWGFAFLITLTILPIIDAVGQTATLLFFAFTNVACWLFVKLWVPETKGRSLEQIELALLDEGSFQSNLKASETHPVRSA